MTVKVIEHYRRFLGDPSRVWVNDLYPFKVAQFSHQPFPASIVYASVGLSEHPLVRPNGVEGAQELVLLVYARFAEKHPEDLLFVVGGDVLNRGKALRNGEILGPAGPLVREATVDALLCASPPFLPDDFDQIDQPRPIIIVGLVPITRDEAKYAETHGWSALQKKLIDEQPDILDLQRMTMPVHSE